MRAVHARSACLIAVLAFVSGASGQGSGLFSEQAVVRGLDYHVALGANEYGCGAAMSDLDNDGDPDIVLTGKAGGVVGVYENDGSGHFIDRSATAGIPNLLKMSSVTSADYDGDGDLDLFFGNHVAPDLLMRNDGGFIFTDVTAASGIIDSGAAMGACWGDYDDDGDLDLYVCNRTGAFATTQRNRLWRNNGDGTFTDVAEALGVTDGNAPTLLATWLDYDQDGDQDLYLGTDKGSGPVWTNTLYQNQGDGTFLDVTTAAGAEANVDCMGIAIGDFDSDGWDDLYLTNITLGNVLLISNGDGTFRDETVAAGVGSYLIGWACAFFDFEHDARLDLYVCCMAAPNRFYRTTAGAFPCADIAASCGIDDPATSFCMALGDIDDDGDLDLLVQSYDQNIRLYVNNKGDDQTWVKMNVVGQGANTHAVGARVRVSAGGPDQMREIYAGSNYKSQNDYTVHFGLNGETMVDTIHVRWPATGDTRTLTNYPAEYEWTIYPPERMGDSDNDGDLDVKDLRAALRCLTGPVPGSIRPGCELFDMDGDGDVDGRDLIELGFGKRNAL